MADPLKHKLGAGQVARIAKDVARVFPSFPVARFTEGSLRGLEALELKARGAHIAGALRACLPEDPRRAMRIATRALGPKLKGTSGAGDGDVFRFFAFSSLLEALGPLDVEAALIANQELTQRFTAEFSLRPLLLQHPEVTLQALRAWAKHPNAHVRRAVSEAARPRLPWAPALPAFKQDPAPVLQLLEALKDDPSEYVRRSVANNLNDIAKDHPERVLETAQRWLEGASTARRRLVEHALRTLVKRADARALALLGAKAPQGLAFVGRVRPTRALLGDSVQLSCTVTNSSDAVAHVVADARVHFPAVRGTSMKVFRLGRGDVEPAAERVFSIRLPLVHRTIRELQAGRHHVDVQVNGHVRPAGFFDLRQKRGR